MRNTDLYGRILGIEAPWSLKGLNLRLEAVKFNVRVGQESQFRRTFLPMPETECVVEKDIGAKRWWVRPHRSDS